LRALGLKPEEIAALTCNGSISRESRARRTIIFKLRYRVAGRQCVKYLGTDERLVEHIRSELKDLQASHRRGRRLHRLDEEARELLRACKQRLELHLEQAGLKFHGRAIRRLRNRNDVINNTSTKP
jgi:hypothetical protein